MLDGWSLDLYKSRKRGGLGVSKDIFKNDKIEIDTGVFVTKRLHHLLNYKIRPDVAIGISGRWRF